MKTDTAFAVFCFFVFFYKLPSGAALAVCICMYVCVCVRVCVCMYGSERVNDRTCS